MNKYENGKIYKITSKQTDDVYIGSTCKTLNDRFSTHKTNSKSRCYSLKIIKYDDVIIELIEEYPCETKQELLWRERYWIENMKCINVALPITTIDEKLAKHKEYYENNKDIINTKNKEYRSNHKKECTISNAKYRATHIEEIKLYKKINREKHLKQNLEWRIINRDKINIKQRFQRTEFGQLCKMFY